MNIGVVGVGHLGKHHARLYRSMAGVRLTAVADLLPERAREIAGQYQATPVTDYRELLDRVDVDRIDAVSVAVPTVAHHAVASAFLKRRIPVLVEKPLAATIDEARDLVRLARENKTILQVGHVERFNPAIAAVREYLGTPRFIECHRLAPFSFRSTDIDVVLDLMIHDIDIILHLARNPLKRTDAVGVSLLFGKEDIANARLEFENGCVANVTASRISDKAMRKMRIFSGESYVSVDFMAKSAMVYWRSPELEKVLPPAGVAPTPEDLAAIPKQFYAVKEIKIPEREPLAAELESFVDAVKNGTPPAVSGEDGLLAMETAEVILREIRDHRWK